MKIKAGVCKTPADHRLADVKGSLRREKCKIYIINGCSAFTGYQITVQKYTFGIINAPDKNQIATWLLLTILIYFHLY